MPTIVDPYIGMIYTTPNNTKMQVVAIDAQGAPVLAPFTNPQIPGSLRQQLTADKTVVIPLGSTAAETQAIIDSQPMSNNGYKVTYMFDAGVFQFDETILFSDSCLLRSGGGTITTENRATTIEFIGTRATRGFMFRNCQDIDMRGLGFSVLTGMTGIAVEFRNVVGVYMVFNTYKSVYTNKNLLYFYSATGVYADTSKFGQGYAGIAASVSSTVFEKGNTVMAAESPLYGLSVSAGAIVSTDGASMTGSVANNIIANNGFLR